MNDATKKEPRKLTVLIDADLERRLLEEREKVAKDTGITASLTQIATRAMRDGLRARAG
ncbi:hypothetical protein [Azotobacter salinestris]|uniref:hypothetical protein n=1 Tax=Azotobacter salinestris TaxID=69964 RepID=UPI0032DE9303